MCPIQAQVTSTAGSHMNGNIAIQTFGGWLGICARARILGSEKETGVPPSRCSCQGNLYRPYGSFGQTFSDRYANVYAATWPSSPMGAAGHERSLMGPAGNPDASVRRSSPWPCHGSVPRSVRGVDSMRGLRRGRRDPSAACYDCRCRIAQGSRSPGVGIRRRQGFEAPARRGGRTSTGSGPRSRRLRHLATSGL